MNRCSSTYSVTTLFIRRLVLSSLLVALFAPGLPADEIVFDRDVLPILADKCYACHGPDEGQREADLRLDEAESTLIDRGGYQVIVPGKPEESELVRRITAEADEQMPPADYFKQLTDAERQTLIEWIRQGAPRSEHWAYVAPRRHPVPAVAHSGWTNNFIDAFILAELERRHIEPAPPADRRTLVRRLSFDLTGLPPSRQMVDEFLNDTSPSAYEKLVDRLLHSVHFGERMAVYWLDLVRYADTVGYHGDQDVSVSPYRDYVINSFNTDKPFDEFTIEQLAGDLLEDRTVEHLVASGYNRLGMMSAEGGVQPEEYLAKYIADRVRNAGTVWLGSTLECAECHDHKFDPFTTRDFYCFEAFFADIKEKGLYAGAHATGDWGPRMDVSDPQLSALLEPIDQRLSALKNRLEEQDWPELDAAQQQWEKEQLGRWDAWHLVAPVAAVSERGTELEILADGSVLAKGKEPDQDVYRVDLNLSDETTRWLRIDVLPHSSLPHGGPGRAGNGNFVISEVKLMRTADDQEEQISFVEARADFEQQDGAKNPYRGWKAAAAIDQEKHGTQWGWAILPQVGSPHALLLKAEKPLPSGRYRLIIEQRHSNPKHTVGRFVIYATCNDDPGSLADTVAVPMEVRSALTVPPEKRSVDQQRVIRRYYRSLLPQTAPLRQEIASLEKRRADLVAEHTRSTLITVAVPPREIRVLPRGNWMDKSGEVVQPQTPEFLPPLHHGPGRATRLDLARWLVSRDNPLTARVMVNRLWKIMFGRGLSATLDDFGTQGDRPSHPELLDTLAVEFMESGWDIKHILKLMAMSATYRQSSLPRSELETTDPYNRLLARQNRFRLDAEFLRDNALAVSGLLVREVGGRSVKPYQPEGLYEHLNFPKRKYVPDVGRHQYRRGVYTHWQRQFLHPALKAFDAPSRETCTAERPRSNTPLGALVLLNDPSYVEAAQRFAERALTEGPKNADQRARWMIREAIGREATAEEIRVLVDLVRADAAWMADRLAQVQQFLHVGQSAPSPEVDPVELASWTSAARAIFNMHEFITRN